MALLPLGTKIVVVHPPQPVKRSWRERLFSRQTHRTPVSARWEAVERAGGGFLFVAPTTFNALKQHTKASAFPDLGAP